MAGILDTIAAEVFKGFKGKLLKGTLKRVALDPAAGLDRFGDPQETSTTTWTCEGFIDNSTRGFRGQDKIPENAVTVCIFGRSVATTPSLDDLVQFPQSTGPWYQIMTPVRTDPANALWECGAVLVQGSGDECRARGI